jgi:hypothetical protein
MGDFVLNDALGRIAEKVADGADLIIIPLSAMDADATVKDAGPDLSTVLGLAGTTEQTTTWSRKVITNGTITLTVDDSSDLVKVIVPDQTWTGPTAGNNVTDILVCEDGASDAVRPVLSAHDFAVTADGNDVTADFHATNGFWQSS